MAQPRRLRRFLPRSAALAAFLSLPLPGQCEPAFQPGELLGTPRGSTFAMQVFDPDGGGVAPDMLVVGGRFDVGASLAVSIAAYDGSEWQLMGSSPAGTCTALSVFNSRLVGAFSRTSISSEIAAFDGTAWQTLGFMIGVANAMTIFNGNLVLGGAFNSVNGVSASNVIQWNGTTWSALGVNAGGVGGTVRALAVYSGVLYVGGDITHASGIPVGNLAVWTGTGWASTGFFNGPVQALAVRSTTTIATSFLFVGGQFSAVGVIPAQSVARFNAVDGWTAVGAGLPVGGCTALHVRSTGLTGYAVTAGVYGAAASVYRLTGSTWNPISPAFGGPAAFTLFRGRYVAITTSAPNVRALDASGAWLPLSGAGIDGQVTAVHTTASDVVIGGAFTFISGVQMNGIARGRFGNWQPLGAGVLGGWVRAIASLSNGDLIAAGDFTSAGGVIVNRIARWDGGAWSPLGSGLSGVVYALTVLANGHVVAAGNFLQAGGVNANHVALWNGSAWTAMGSGVDDSASSLVVRPNGEVIVGGIFSTASGQAARGIARWNGTAWLPMTGGQPNAAVSAIAVLSNGDLLVGGFFNAIGAQSSNHLARWNGVGWSPAPGYTHAIFSTVGTIVPLPNNEAIVAGYSVQSGGPRFARFNGQAVVALPGPLVTFSAGARSPTGEVLLAGAFSAVGTVPSAFLARYASPCPAITPPYGTGCTGSGGFNALRATQLPWIGTTFRAEATGMPASGLVMSVFGLTPTSIPLASVLRQGLPGCDLLATLDLLESGSPRLGRWQTQLALPSLATLIGQVLHHQVVALELDAGNNLIAVTASNGLRLTIGVF